MPDTYYSFVMGYGAFMILFFALAGFLLKRVLRLEKEIQNIQQNSK